MTHLNKKTFLYILNIFSYVIDINYAAAIPETIKSKVISQWLLGLRRDIIAQDNNISAGSFNNIIYH